LATAGVVSTIYAAYKKEPAALWVSLGYFTLMEILQAFTYSVIDQCNNPSNQMATLLGYLHITFQPFFISAVSLHFINQNIARKITPFIYTLCFIGVIMDLIALYPFTWSPLCAGLPLCGETLCSVHGSWHIAWMVPVNTTNHNFYWYTLSGFILPIFYGSWRFTIYHILIGPGLAFLTTSNPNEWPAVWCLFSIGLLLIVIKTPIRQLLYVRHWWLWSLIE